MTTPENKRETGARILPGKADADTMDEFSQDSAANNPPKTLGNSEPIEDVEGKTPHSDRVKSSNASGAVQKVTGAGPAVARHSKDAE